MDRNWFLTVYKAASFWSLSARRAWIEISAAPQPGKSRSVALRKESVDRNINEDVSYSIIVKSLSARRAWIEIGSCYLDNIEITQAVALRKESVDRNIILPKQLDRTPPSLSARRAWIEIAKSTPEEAKR